MTTTTTNKIDVSVAQVAAIALIDKFKEQDRRIAMLEAEVRRLNEEIKKTNKKKEEEERVYVR
jgi:uncharacterized small protein (DUF1192 family)